MAVLQVTMADCYLSRRAIAMTDCSNAFELGHEMDARKETAALISTMANVGSWLVRHMPTRRDFLMA